jgi:general stress protein 26
MTKTTDRNEDNRVSAEKKLDDLYALIEGIEVAMFTTRRPDGRMVSRPMQVQKREAGADLWFVTDVETHKMDELEHDDQVNLAFYNTKSREWVSVAGRAMITQDRQIIRELYKPDWKAWFGDEGGERDGGPDDPRLALILVSAESVTYLKSDRPKPLVLFEVVKAMVTGQPPKTGDLRQMGERELQRGAAREVREQSEAR